MQIFRVITLLIIFAFLGCASPHPDIKVNKAIGIAENPKKIFIVSDLDDSKFGNGDIFFGKLTQIMQGCGAVTEKFIIGSLALDDDDQRKAMAAFSPDFVLEIKFIDRYMAGTVYSSRYKITLFDIQQRMLIWSAAVTQNKSGWPETVETIAEDITNQMKKDGIFKSCPPIKPTLKGYWGN